MDSEARKEIAFRMIMRVETGLSFIKDKFVYEPLRKRMLTPDIAWIRNAYILFSFYIELLLKAELVLTGQDADAAELDNRLRKLGHNFNAILGKMDNVNDIGIKNFSFKNGEYKINTYDKTIHVKDFSDIRYDFIEGKLRELPLNENEIIKESLEGADQLIRKIKARHFS